MYLNEDKEKARSWFHVCDNLNVPLDGIKYGLIRSITYTDEFVNPQNEKNVDHKRVHHITIFRPMDKAKSAAGGFVPSAVSRGANSTSHRVYENLMWYSHPQRIRRAIGLNR